MYTLLQYCTNITEFVVQNPDQTFWTQLSCAGNQGRLKYLQRLPRPLQRKFDYYMYTAFLFKVSLTDLVLFDSKDDNSSFYNIESEEYREFVSHIKEFPNLQHLEIIQYCRHDLGYFDAIIDDYQQLKSLKINTNFKDLVWDKKILPTITEKHHEIQELGCHWSLVNNDDLLKYIMEKFPSLQKMTIDLYEWDGPVYFSSVSPDVMISFLQYVFNNIPTFNLGFLLNTENFIDIWLDLQY